MSFNFSLCAEASLYSRTSFCAALRYLTELPYFKLKPKLKSPLIIL
jgi:hypothetical protein